MSISLLTASRAMSLSCFFPTYFIMELHPKPVRILRCLILHYFVFMLSNLAPFVLFFSFQVLKIKPKTLNTLPRIHSQPNPFFKKYKSIL